MTLFDLFGTLPRCRLPEAKSATSSSLFLDGDLEESFPTKVFLRKSLAFLFRPFPIPPVQGRQPSEFFLQKLGRSNNENFSSSSQLSSGAGFAEFEIAFQIHSRDLKKTSEMVKWPMCACCESQTKRAFCTYTNMKSSV